MGAVGGVAPDGSPGVGLRCREARTVDASRDASVSLESRESIVRAMTLQYGDESVYAEFARELLHGARPGPTDSSECIRRGRRSAIDVATSPIESEATESAAKEKERMVEEQSDRERDQADVEPEQLSEAQEGKGYGAGEGERQQALDELADEDEDESA